jgi:DNA-binding winged helix-turn-helix (wHTH) protein/tetratricopeptide (TPR) repeat protein
LQIYETQISRRGIIGNRDKQHEGVSTSCATALAAKSPMKKFAAFRLDTLNQCLWRRADGGREERILLTPKAFAVLEFLVDRPGRLVSHKELLRAVWPNAVVDPQAVKRHVLAVRSALGDRPRKSLPAVRSALGDRPRKSLFIETIPKRGYRFIAQVSEIVDSRSIVSSRRAQDLVGRGSALEVLHEAWQRALSGARQIVFITGEPGIGKTALAEEFQRQVALGERTVHMAHGQCIEGYGSKEAYGPMLDALGRLCRGPQAGPIVQILLSDAPTWLAQLPSLLTPEHREKLQREILGATRERMVREIGDALESITAQTALLLVLEDLHWVDDSTVDIISALARRRTPAKLMLLATCRRLDAEPPSYPLRALMPYLLVHRLCREIDLTQLSEAEVEEYLAAQSPAARPPPGLSALVHRHSEGNPLFMVAALEHMAKRGLLTRASGRWQLQVPLEQIEFEVPDDLRHMIEAQLEPLSAAERSALELASVSGASFSASVIGAAADLDSHSLENLYEELSRRHHIVKWVGTHALPDGSMTERYAFVHVLYRQVLYDRQLPGRRARSHGLIGERLAALYTQRMEEVATELVYHFEQAGDWPRAIDSLQQAAEIAGRRYAHRQADSILARALELVSRLPEAQRAQTEPQLLASLAAHRTAAFDTRAAETYETLAARAADFGLIDVQVRALLDLSLLLSFTSAERCLEVVQRALPLSAEQDPVIRIRTRTACAFRRLSVSGWNAQDAHEIRVGLAELGKGQGLPALDSDLLEASQHYWESGEYREGRRLALEVRAKRLEPGTNPIEYERAGFLAALNLVFLGEWGDALKEFSAGIAGARKNANDRHTLRVRIQQAWLHLHALDFRGVRVICDSVLAPLRNPALRTTSGQPIGYPAQLRRALILSGSASAGLGDYASALEDLSTAASEMDHQTMFLDWYWHMPLAAGLTELWLATGDCVRAQREAARFLDKALATEERTWQGLAWETNARVALGKQDYARARECIGNAVSAVQGFEVPLAAWQVHATAAHIEEESGNLDSARSHGDLSRTTILRLANSLPEEEPLRDIFLSAPAVARVLSR